MKDVTAQRPSSRSARERAGLSMVPPQPATKNASKQNVAQSQQISSLESGIVVSEEELRSIKAQRLYKMRCECGRSWFELDLPTLVECPACRKLGLVSA
jgi:hypothetical protein